MHALRMRLPSVHAAFRWEVILRAKVRQDLVKNLDSEQFALSNYFQVLSSRISEIEMFVHI